MIFLAIVSNTKTVPAGSGLGKLGLITYTQFKFQGRALGASSTCSIMGHGKDHLTRRHTRHDACIPVVKPYQTTAAKRCAGGMQASAASPVWTKSFRLASQEEIERLKPGSHCPSPELIYHSQTKNAPTKKLSFIVTRGKLKEAI
ncbi:MAG TPA: hypothetical protein PLO17_03590 [Alcaligenes phenolicus]|uniref:hypothetical protein n=1 Tax=Alcaligenes phenolicus TaxID=232846 RepID=UPI002CB7CE05|nr:hypothetical protein [Alcaligenes phenolicus]HRO19460.1 hypothetical protein [Alcaligenes phenolicus]